MESEKNLKFPRFKSVALDLFKLCYCEMSLRSVYRVSESDI